jgi:hypothetical protein
MSAADGLTAALAAEHAAIFGYGTVGAHLDGAARTAARQAEAAHRSRRDALIARLTSLKATPPPARPAYALPFPVKDKATAQQLAVTLEERVAQAWAGALAATAGDERKLALDALVDCAVRATRWRKLAKITPTTVPFPGSTA